MVPPPQNRMPADHAAEFLLHLAEQDIAGPVAAERDARPETEIGEHLQQFEVQLPARLSG